MCGKTVQVRVLSSTNVAEAVHGRGKGGDEEGNASNGQ